MTQAVQRDYAARRAAESCAAQGVALVPTAAVLDVAAAILATRPPEAPKLGACA